MHYKPSFAVERVLDLHGYTVSKTEITVRDMRTKEESTHVVYFLGREIPWQFMARSLGEYGFELMTMKKVDEVRGAIAWKDIFYAMKKAEGVSDERKETQ